MVDDIGGAISGDLCCDNLTKCNVAAELVVVCEQVNFAPTGDRKWAGIVAGHYFAGSIRKG